MPRKKTDPTEVLRSTLTGAHPPAPGTPESKAQGYDDLPPNTGKVVQRKSPATPVKQGVSGETGVKGNQSQETSPAVLPPGQAQVVASLVATGYSYAEAVAMLGGGPRPGPAPATGGDRKPSKEELEEIKRLSEGNDDHLPPVPDVEEKFVLVDVDLAKRPEFRTLLDDYWTRREEMEDVPKKTRYRITIDLEGPEFDWLLHRTITEGQSRKDAEWSVQRTMNLLLKQQKMLDPTKGNRRTMGSSGPKDQFSPATGGWTKQGA